MDFNETSHSSLKSHTSLHAYAEIRVLQTTFTCSLEAFNVNAKRLLA